jgi:hypothetical protein
MTAHELVDKSHVHRAVLARARAISRGEEEDRGDDVRDQVRAYSQSVVSAIDAIVSSSET